MANTGIVLAEEYLWHNTGSGWILPSDGKVLQPYEHPENPETKRRIVNLWERSGLLAKLTRITPNAVTIEDIVSVHTAEYVEQIEATSASGGGDAGGLTPFGFGSYEIALLSAGGCIAAVDAVLDGTVDNAYAMVRPPGHHAIAESGMGFCLFNNAAIAVRHLQRNRGVGRVAMVDWDVHHGNGQQAVFYDDPSVLTISIHQDNCFPPDSGHITDVGEGAGAGANINVPLPPGSGNGAYLAAYEQVVLPALARFQPGGLCPVHRARRSRGDLGHSNRCRRSLSVHLRGSWRPGTPAPPGGCYRRSRFARRQNPTGKLTTAERQPGHSPRS